MSDSDKLGREAALKFIDFVRWGDSAHRYHGLSPARWARDIATPWGEAEKAFVECHAKLNNDPPSKYINNPNRDFYRANIFHEAVTILIREHERKRFGITVQASVNYDGAVTELVSYNFEVEAQDIGHALEKGWAVATATPGLVWEEVRITATSWDSQQKTKIYKRCDEDLNRHAISPGPFRKPNAQCLISHSDTETCDECGAEIPDSEPNMVNRRHRDSCSLYPREG